jgi:DNA repair exonuclease SbcCD ATPase subunit
MGLFRKRNEDSTQLDSLRTELDSMRERLDGADRTNAVLETRLTAIDQSNETFEQRLEKAETVSQAEPTPLLVSTPAPPPPPPAGNIGAAAINEGDLNEIAGQLEELSVTVAAHYTELSAGRAQMDAVDGLNERFGEIAEQISTIDVRVTNVSFELANQLTELSRDIEAVSEQRSASTEQPPITPVAAIEDQIEDQIDSALDEVRESAERLAAEQARYEIQFREDLADLAERMRRSGSS